MVNLPIHDDPNITGGFLYNPPRSEFNNYYVLLPADRTNSQIHTYYKLYRQFPFAMASDVEINLFNGTDQSGFAGTVRHNLRRFGFKINQVSNADNKNYQKTQVEIIGQNELLAQQVMEAINLLLHIPDTQISYAAADPNNSLTIDNPEILTNPDKISINITLGADLKEVNQKLNVFASLYSKIEQAIRENRAAQRENQLLNTDPDLDTKNNNIDSIDTQETTENSDPNTSQDLSENSQDSPDQESNSTNENNQSSDTSVDQSDRKTEEQN